MNFIHNILETNVFDIGFSLVSVNDLHVYVQLLQNLFVFFVAFINYNVKRRKQIFKKNVKSDKSGVE